MRGDIAGAARIAVVAPRAADIGRLLDDEERIDAGPAQRHAHAQSAEAGADDENGDVLPAGARRAPLADRSAAALNARLNQGHGVPTGVMAPDARSTFRRTVGDLAQ